MFTRIVRIPLGVLLMVLALALAGCAPMPAAEPPGLATPPPEEPTPADSATAPAPGPTDSPEPGLEATSTPAADGAPPAASGPSPVAVTTAPAEATLAPEPTVEMPAAVRLEPVAEGLTAPIAMAFSDPEGTRAIVIDQVGLVRVLDTEAGLLPEPFLDLRDRMVALRAGYDERGLLGLALHPGYAENGRLFVYYSAPLSADGPQGWNHTSRLSEFAVSADSPDRADPASERVILEIHQPQANHNGGALAFGPDGYLYISLGDGGAANDVGAGHSDVGNGQDRTNLLGSILRIDVDGQEPYGIPPDNPFVSDADAAAGHRPEIWAYGFRNPFRMGFDPQTGDLFVGDVGQALWEEVSLLGAGGNYGWRIREGLHCFSPSSPGSPPAECPTVGAGGEPLIDPIVEYGQPGTATGYGNSVIGGYVYRGEAIPGLTGRYVFGDWTGSLSGSRPEPTLLVATRDADAPTGWRLDMLPVADAPRAFILSFAQDPAGEVYVLTTGSGGPSGSSGRIWKIVP